MELLEASEKNGAQWRSSPEQRERIDRFIDGLSREQLTKIMTPLSDDQKEAMLVLHLDIFGEIHPMDRAWLDERSRSRGELREECEDGDALRAR